MKNARLYLFSFQSNAGGSQGYATKLVHFLARYMDFRAAIMDLCADFGDDYCVTARHIIVLGMWKSGISRSWQGLQRMRAKGTFPTQCILGMA
jgi:hypothetical protein